MSQHTSIQGKAVKTYPGEQMEMLTHHFLLAFHSSLLPLRPMQHLRTYCNADLPLGTGEHRIVRSPDGFCWRKNYAVVITSFVITATNVVYLFFAVTRIGSRQLGQFRSAAIVALSLQQNLIRQLKKKVLCVTNCKWNINAHWTMV